VTCESGDSIVRLALHQPDTKFAKRRTTIAFRSHQTLANFQSELPLSVRLYLDDNLPFGGDEPTDVCELYLFYDEVVYMLASVDPNAEANGLTSIEIFHQDDRKSGTTKETTGAVHSVGSDWAVQCMICTSRTAAAKNAMPPSCSSSPTTPQSFTRADGLPLTGRLSAPSRERPAARRHVTARDGQICARIASTSIDWNSSGSS
jgi:hypothetical protein